MPLRALLLIAVSLAAPAAAQTPERWFSFATVPSEFPWHGTADTPKPQRLGPFASLDECEAARIGEADAARRRADAIVPGFELLRGRAMDHALNTTPLSQLERLYRLGDIARIWRDVAICERK